MSKTNVVRHVAQCCSCCQSSQAIDFFGKNCYSYISYPHIAYPQKLLAVGAKQSRVFFQTVEDKGEELGLSSGAAVAEARFQIIEKIGAKFNSLIGDEV